MRRSKKVNDPGMRIISGIARGTSLSAPDGLGVRPTSVRARKALFDSLGNFSGTVVADLFAGSGALGLEAASRGAEAVVFVEEDERHCQVIRRNVESASRAEVDCRSSVLTGSVQARLREMSNFSPRYDFVFADPPYGKSSAYFKRFAADVEFHHAFAGAKMIWEIPPRSNVIDFPLRSPSWSAGTRRRFGGTSFLILNLNRDFDS